MTFLEKYRPQKRGRMVSLDRFANREAKNSVQQLIYSTLTSLELQGFPKTSKDFQKTSEKLPIS